MRLQKRTRKLPRTRVAVDLRIRCGRAGAGLAITTVGNVTPCLLGAGSFPGGSIPYNAVLCKEAGAACQRRVVQPPLGFGVWLGPGRRTLHNIYVIGPETRAPARVPAPRRRENDDARLGCGAVFGVRVGFALESCACAKRARNEPCGAALMPQIEFCRSSVSVKIGCRS